jgi:RNA polymerase sigma factor (sigma-70 family)
MRQVAAGEITGLETLYDRYHTMAYALALRITTETGLAEDVVQDSFLGVWRNAARYAEAKGSVKGWLLAIVRHRAIDAIRRQRNGVALADETDGELLPTALTLPDIWPEVAGRLDAEQVRDALTILPPAQREVIELAYFDGLTQREIADRTHAPLGTVKSRMRLGLGALREQLTAPVTGPNGKTSTLSSTGRRRESLA